MSYQRVMPRDLFNESKLLKCLGQLSLKTMGFSVKSISFDHNADEPFVIKRDINGWIYCSNITIRIRGVPYYFKTPLNSREPYPLMIDRSSTSDLDDIAVFSEKFPGELSHDMLLLLTGRE